MVDVFKTCIVKIAGQHFCIDLVMLPIIEYNVILGMFSCLLIESFLIVLTIN